MFGPDRCGSTSKVHFIFRHVNPVTGEIEEKHLTAPPSPRITKTTAVYTLVVRPDQTFEISINGDKAKSGSLLEDFTPAVNPPIDIDDPNDKKPSDWVETPKISDPHAVKPADWDEDAPATIADPDAVKPAGWLDNESPVVPDPEAQKPDEWSDEDDGDWVAPLVSNPKCEAAPGCGEWKRPEVPNRASPLVLSCSSEVQSARRARAGRLETLTRPFSPLLPAADFKGKWFAPLVDNPDYKGPWAPRKIACVALSPLSPTFLELALTPSRSHSSSPAATPTSSPTCARPTSRPSAASASSCGR